MADESSARRLSVVWLNASLLRAVGPTFLIPMDHKLDAHRERQ